MEPTTDELEFTKAEAQWLLEAIQKASSSAELDEMFDEYKDRLATILRMDSIIEIIRTDKELVSLCCQCLGSLVDDRIDKFPEIFLSKRCVQECVERFLQTLIEVEKIFQTDEISIVVLKIIENWIFVMKMRVF
ncbi:hypothetical protein ADUPG1_012442 [Aduncisulcus paluster]|uniref:Uncharacterized protein n=1 Tax=Aduncisulcus paluster TaxID=2918883 RepID=A0ABQ5K499_9EUKA|nr:hypothetical protein ADUPG1_012442 [Aduncisulcus paluster]